MELKHFRLVCITGGMALEKGIEALPPLHCQGGKGVLTKMELKHVRLISITRGLSRMELKNSRHV
jgi:hypothetical protein